MRHAEVKVPNQHLSHCLTHHTFLLIKGRNSLNMFIDISWVQWEPKREDVKFHWHRGRKRSCNEKGVYRGLERSLTDEFVLNKHKWRRGKCGDISNRRSKSSLQRYRGDPCPNCNSYLCPESTKLVATCKTGPARWAGDDGNVYSMWRNLPCSY